MVCLSPLQEVKSQKRMVTLWCLELWPVVRLRDAVIDLSLCEFLTFTTVKIRLQTTRK